MTVPAWIMRRLDRLVETLPARRPPDFVIGDEADRPYLRRWWVLPRNRFFNVYLHQFCRSDDDRALHSHPWSFNASILIRGRYLEHLPGDISVAREPGQLYWRRGEAWHRVELYEGLCPGTHAGRGLAARTDIMEWANGIRAARGEPPLRTEPLPCWTLFITGPRVREWGFACPQGVVHWRDFTAPGTNGAKTGKGCDQ